MTFALLQAEEPVPLAAYAVVALGGASAVWALFGRELLHELRGVMAPVFVAAAVSTVLALTMVMSLGYQTLFFVRHDMREVGTASQRVPVMPETLVSAARASLRENDKWALTTPVGRCEKDLYRYIWLEFRLLPNISDCQSPNIEIFFRTPVRSDGKVLSAESDWAIVRR